MNKENEKLAMKVSWHTIIGNVVLSAGKLVAGIVGHSAAMLSDAVHSLSDVISTAIVMIGVKMANKTADKEHPYGHERFECIAALLLAAILCMTGLGIGYGGIQAITAGDYQSLSIPNVLALGAAVISIIIKEAMYKYTKIIATKINSGALMADAWHHRSDALSSVGSFIGIIGARMGFPILDSVASLVICIFIMKAAFDICIDAIHKLTDHACDDTTTAAIHSAIVAQENVQSVDVLRTRLFGDKIYVDVEISLDGSISLHTSHAIAHQVHDVVEKQFSTVKHCMVHVNPKM